MLPDLKLAMRRGFSGRCPQCGEGKLFASWHQLHDRCSVCRLDLGHLEQDTWGLMYFSTAALTGLVVIGMFLFRPSSVLTGLLVMAPVAVATLLLTLPYRKALAMGAAYFIELRFNNGDGLLRLRGPRDRHA